MKRSREALTLGHASSAAFAVRALQLSLAVGLAARLAGQVISALVLSKHALAFLPALPGSAWARRAHMLCSYWSFMIAFAHAGFRVKGVLARTRGSVQPGSAARWAARIIAAAMAAFGAVSFVRNLLFHQRVFVFLRR